MFVASLDWGEKKHSQDIHGASFDDYNTCIANFHKITTETSYCILISTPFSLCSHVAAMLARYHGESLLFMFCFHL
jgi:hypothetical protein